MTAQRFSEKKKTNKSRCLIENPHIGKTYKLLEESHSLIRSGHSRLDIPMAGDAMIIY